MTTRVSMSHMVTIETHYLGPTDYRGSRIVARTANGQRLVRPYDHALDIDDNHAAAAVDLADRMTVDHAWPPIRLHGGATIDGYTFTMERI